MVTHGLEQHAGRARAEPAELEHSRDVGPALQDWASACDIFMLLLECREYSLARILMRQKHAPWKSLADTASSVRPSVTVQRRTSACTSITCEPETFENWQTRTTAKSYKMKNNG